MKIKITSLLLIAILLGGCTQNEISYDKNHNNIENNDELEDVYAEQIYYYEEQIQYYENLCDEYGYQTYDGVYNPEKWRYYYDTEKNDQYYHTDWLCEYFNKDNSYYISANPNILEKEGYINCLNCNLKDNDICFFDEKEKIVHKNKNDIILGTNDYISAKRIYRFISYDRAKNNNLMLCEKCFSE